MLLFIHRLRPYDANISHLLVPKTADLSFPSDHAMASLSIVFSFALQSLRRWAVIFLTLATLVCVSRIFVGMHYVSDIFGGSVVAFFPLMLLKRFTWKERSLIVQSWVFFKQTPPPFLVHPAYNNHKRVAVGAHLCRIFQI
jgi:undecaprenyl-diphosphatase